MLQPENVYNQSTLNRKNSTNKSTRYTQTINAPLPFTALLQKPHQGATNGCAAYHPFLIFFPSFFYQEKKEDNLAINSFPSCQTPKLHNHMA